MRNYLALIAGVCLLFVLGGCGAADAIENQPLPTSIPTFTPAAAVAMRSGSTAAEIPGSGTAPDTESTDAEGTDAATATPLPEPTATTAPTEVVEPTEEVILEPTDEPTEEPTTTPEPTSAAIGESAGVDAEADAAAEDIEEIGEPTAESSDTAADDTTTNVDTESGADVGEYPEAIASFFPDQADPATGERLTNSNGCVACHSLQEGVVMVGPSWYNLANLAATRVEDQSAAQYIYASIVAPNEYIVDGFNAGLMPQNYAEVISDEDLAHIVAYLLTLDGQ